MVNQGRIFVKDLKRTSAMNQCHVTTLFHILTMVWSSHYKHILEAHCLEFRNAHGDKERHPIITKIKGLIEAEYNAIKEKGTVKPLPPGNDLNAVRSNVFL
jgi:hypothetical protein